MHGWSKDAIRAAAVELGRPSVVAGLVKVALNFFFKSHNNNIFLEGRRC